MAMRVPKTADLVASQIRRQIVRGDPLGSDDGHEIAVTSTDNLVERLVEQCGDALVREHQAPHLVLDVDRGRRVLDDALQNKPTAF